ARESVSRYLDDVPALLRTQDDVREAGARLPRLSGWVRNGRRAVRGADPDPDREGAAFPRRVVRLVVLDADARVGARPIAAARNDLARRSRAALLHLFPGGSRTAHPRESHLAVAFRRWNCAICPR